MRARPDRTIELIDIDHDAGDYAQFGGTRKITEKMNYIVRIYTNGGKRYGNNSYASA